MDIEDIETVNITKMETPETDEALTLLYKVKSEYDIGIALTIVGTILFLLFALILTFTTDNVDITYIFWGLFIVNFFAFILCIFIRKIILKPYYELLEIAINNDKVRHEERIRFRERKRLEQEYNEANKSIVPLKANKLEKVREKEINNLETMKSKVNLPARPENKNKGKN